MATLRHRRRLGRRLARLREDRRLTLDTVASRLGWSRPTVSRIEQAQTQPRKDQVEALVALYEVKGEERGTILQLAALVESSAVQPGWWTSYKDVLPDSYVAIEDEARLIRTWQTQLIPGLLQDQEYAWAAISATEEDARIVERRVQARMARRMLLGRKGAPHLHAILDEAVLRRQVGGPQVMRAQLEHLVRSGQQQNVTVQLLPFIVGAHAGVDGPLVILSFTEDADDPDDPDVPYIEGPGGPVYLHADNEIARVNVAWGQISGMALPPEASLEFIARLAREGE